MTYDEKNVVMQTYNYTTLGTLKTGVPSWSWQSHSRGIKDYYCNQKTKQYIGFRIKCKY